MAAQELLDINKLETLELSMEAAQFSKFIFNIALEMESNIKEIERSLNVSDFDNVMKRAGFLNTETSKIGATLLDHEITGLQNACLKKQKAEILKSVKKIKKISEKTINVIQDISLLTTYLYLCRQV
ncbi:MAG: hypothetical protein FWE52_01670 [Alphaproteobacteria bacterium]|nr:hypothetical protein [Alphaproteobacteria bacterium]